jgi:hypothetical protein
VYAVDVSLWPRCDAESSLERGYYYHPSRHSAGQPIVAGWAYQFIARLSFERDCWVAAQQAAQQGRRRQQTKGTRERIDYASQSMPENRIEGLFQKLSEYMCRNISMRLTSGYGGKECARLILQTSPWSNAMHSHRLSYRNYLPATFRKS